MSGSTRSIDDGGGRSVLLLAWSGADWQLLGPMLDADQMPHLAGLIAAGTLGHSFAFKPVEPAMALTSAVTGVHGHKHGVMSAVQPRDPEVLTPGVVAVTGACRVVPAVWDHLGASGVTSALVNWPATHPAEPILGTVVTDRFFYTASLANLSGVEGESDSRSAVHPADLAEDLLALRVDPRSITREQMRPFVPGIDRVDMAKDNQLKTLATLIARTATIQNIVTAIVSDLRPGLVAVHFDALALACGHFMDFSPPKHPLVSDEQAQLYGGVVTQTYLWLDQMLGVLLWEAGPEADVVLFSDHGYRSMPAGVKEEKARPKEEGELRPPVDPTTPEDYERPEGMIVCAGPGIRSLADPIAMSLTQLAPITLALLGLRAKGMASDHVVEDLIVPEAIKALRDAPDMTCPRSSDDFWSNAQLVDDLIGLDLVRAPSFEVSTFEQMRLGRARAWGLQALAGGDLAVAAEQLRAAVGLADKPDTRLSLAKVLARLGRDVEASALLDGLDRQTPGSMAVAAVRCQLGTVNSERRGDVP